jgi:hypothetical protein
MVVLLAAMSAVPTAAVGLTSVRKLGSHAVYLPRFQIDAIAVSRVSRDIRTDRAGFPAATGVKLLAIANVLISFDMSDVP